MKATAPILALLLLLAVPPAVLGQAFDFEDAKKRFSAAFRPDRPAADREEAVASLALFDTREAAKLVVSAVKMVESILAPLVEEKAKVDEQLERYRKGDLFDHPEKVDGKAGPSIRKLQSRSGQLQDKIDGERKVLEAIEDALSQMDGGTALTYLQRSALSDSYWKVRRMVATALGVMRVDSSTPFLVEALGDKHDLVVVAAAVALGRMRAKEALDPLLGALDHKSWEVRSATIWSLGELGEKGAVGPLIEQIEKEDGRLREDCAEALSKLTGQAFGQSVDLWKKWWKDHAHEYGEGGKELGGHGAKGSGDAGGDYYGIPIRTNRAIFVLDVSGSMSKSMKDANRDPADGEMSKIDAARKELARALKTYDPKGWFNVVVFNDLVKKWKEKMTRATDASKQGAINFVDTLVAAQSTNIYDALKVAFEVAGMGSRDKHYTPNADTIFLLSDGSPTRPDGSADDWMKIIRAVRDWNKLKRVKIHTIGVGGHNRTFMSMLADENGGKYVSR